MRHLVIGSGGREHALGWKLLQQPGNEVCFLPGNGGTAAIGTVEHICDGMKMKKICEAVSAQREPSAENLEACKALGKKLAEM